MSDNNVSHMIHVKTQLEDEESKRLVLRLPDLMLDPERIYCVMINEVVPEDPGDDFYGGPGAQYLETAIPLFQKAGVSAGSVEEILSMGIYMTNAVKTPKKESAVEKERIEESLPYLERELCLFPHVKVIMLMGDVAKKSLNMIGKKNTKKNVIPAGSTYKIRNEEFYYGDIRVMPSYIMTGKNILIEKSKVQMASEDITRMIAMISQS